MSAFKLPDGPQDHPWIQTFQWLKNPLGYMEECTKNYGEIFTLRIDLFLNHKFSLATPKLFKKFLALTQNN